jgi:Fic family protein
MKNLNNLLDELDRLKAELDKLKPFKREDEERLWKKFRLEWNYNSNHIEGNTLTYGQTELLLIFDKTTGDHDMREYEEMKAHDVAIKLVQEYAADKTRELTEADIRQLNSIILVRPYWGIAQTVDGQQTRKLIEPGVYKREPNSVLLQNGEMFHYASPEETPAKMKALMDWYRKAERDFTLHPVYVAAKMHYDFVRIHPFDDSNGRTSRLLMNYVLLRNGFPPVIIKSSDKKNYLLALNKADVGDFDAFVEYIAKEVVWSINKSIVAAKGENIEDDEDLIKEIEILRRESLKDLESATPKSKEVLLELVHNSFSRLFQLLLESQSQLDIFFVENRKQVSFESLAKEVNTIEEFRDFLIEKIKDVNSNINPQWQNKLSIQFYRTNLKSPPTSQFYLSKSIDILFQGLTYEVKFQEFRFVKKYPFGLSESELSSLSKAVLRESLEEIKSKRNF